MQLCKCQVMPGPMPSCTQQGKDSLNTTGPVVGFHVSFGEAMNRAVAWGLDLDLAEATPCHPSSSCFAEVLMNGKEEGYRKQSMQTLA